MWLISTRPFYIQGDVMGKDKVQMPTSTAGITRYFDDYKSKIRFKPGSLIVMTIIVIIIMIILHTQGNALLGLS